MSPYTLKSPEGDLPLHLSLHFVTSLETKAGNLFKTAHMLIENDLSIKDAVYILTHMYRYAGYVGSSEELTTFLMTKQTGYTPFVLLMNILTHILSPLYHMGAVMPVGKPPTAPHNQQCQQA